MNVLFIVVDDLNDWVGALGGHPQATPPHLDQFVKNGALVFDQAHCPATGASMSGIKTIPQPKGDFLQTYAAVHSPHMHSFHSPDYEILASQSSTDTPPQKVSVYENIGLMNSKGVSIMSTPYMKTEHFANFTHRGPVELTVKMKDRAPDIKEVLIMPTRLGLIPRITDDGRSFSFNVSKPEFMVIIVNGDWFRPLFIYGNPPEENVPDPSDPAVLSIKSQDDFKLLDNRKKLANYRVIRFEPGYHDVGFFFPIFSDQTIYIPGDAYVAGTIVGMHRDKANAMAYGTKLITHNKGIFDYGIFKHGYRNPEDYIYVHRSSEEIDRALGTINNFTIRGRGILSAGKMDWFKGQEDVPSYIIWINKSGSNGVLEGLTLTNRHFHSANFFGTPALLKNAKILYGFHANTDASQWGMIRRNVFSVQGDDGTYIKSGLDIDGWLAWQQNNANVFCFTRNMPNGGRTLGHAHIRNVTVIDGRFGASGIKNLALLDHNP
jgi:hypothetical protein